MKLRRIRLLNQRGMFLLEAILATVILAVTISIIIESLVFGLRATQLTAQYAKAILLADDKLSGDLPARSAGETAQDNKFPEPDEDFSYRRKTADAPGAKEIQEVELTVSWQPGRKEESFSLVTWLYQPPKDDDATPQSY